MCKRIINYLIYQIQSFILNPSTTLMKARSMVYCCVLILHACLDPLTWVIEIIHINQLRYSSSFPAEETWMLFRSFTFSHLHFRTYLRPWWWSLPEKWLGPLPWLFSHSNKTCSACCTWGWAKWLRSHWRAGPAPPLGPAHWSYWLQGWRMGDKNDGMGMEVGKQRGKLNRGMRRRGGCRWGWSVNDDKGGNESIWRCGVQE